MFVNLVDEWLKTELGQEFDKTNSVAIKLALVYFANWLDARSPTLRAPVQSEQKCPTCHGSGKVKGKNNRGVPCYACWGTGISKRSDGG
jgi:hypothetical protein